MFVEWPLGSNAEQAAELAELAVKSGSKTIVGLQGRLGPVFQTVKTLIEGGKIGKVVSSDVTAFGGTMQRDAIGEGLKYFMRRNIGGDIVTIGYGHSRS